MSAHLTIAWITNRLDARPEYFLHSLVNELNRTQFNRDSLSILLVDFHLHFDWDGTRKAVYAAFIRQAGLEGLVRHVPTAPSVWQGPHRLTKEDHFDAAAVRNGAVCYAKDGYFACVDDLSVMLPGWLDVVIEAQKTHYIACGAYKKVKKLVVERGVVKSFEENPPGNDHRLNYPTMWKWCSGQWMYGCSFAAPVEAILKVNGWPAWDCAGMSFEDGIAGVVLHRLGYLFRYDPRMMTYESEELHGQGKPFRRDDPGVSPKDKSHALLDRCKASVRFHNEFGDGIQSLSDLRQRILNGGEFPIPTTPTHEWFTGKALPEL